MLSHAYCAKTTYILCKNVLPPLEADGAGLGDDSAAIDIDLDPDCVANGSKQSGVTDELLRDSNV